MFGLGFLGIPKYGMINIKRILLVCVDEEIHSSEPEQSVFIIILQDDIVELSRILEKRSDFFLFFLNGMLNRISECIGCGSDTPVIVDDKSQREQPCCRQEQVAIPF